MSGNVYPTPTLQWGTLLQDPTTAMQTATKEYVDGKIGGVPEAPTDGQTYGRNGSTTSWVPVPAAGTQVSSFNTRTGAVTLALPDITGAGGAPNANPSFTGTTTAANLQVSGTVGGAGFTSLLSPYALSASTLALSGGTMTGPLMITATGGNTSRSVQDQLGDIVDVKDFGAKGDGTTVDTAAFTAAAATGKTIVVTPGTYIIGPITISQSMIGMGMATTILRAAPGGNPTNDTLITQNAPASSVIRDLMIDGANLCLYGVYCLASTTQQTGLRFERLQVANMGNTSSTASPLPIGIFIQLDETRPTSKQAIVVADCYVHNIYGNGISIGGEGCIVTHNTVVNVGSAGISIDILQDGIISDNTINSPGQVAVMAADGVTGYYHLNLRVLISNNTITNSGNNGIHIGGHDIQIIGNKIYNTTLGGIMLASDPNAAPTPSTTGTISNNEIDTAGGAGIAVRYFSRVLVIGNNISNVNVNGIQIAVSSDCIVADNVLWTVSTSGSNGIYLDTAVNCQVRGNRVNGTLAQAIFDAGGSTNAQISDNIVTSEGTTSNWDYLLTVLGSGVVNVPGGTLSLTNATSNFLLYNTAGSAVPTYTTRSVGTKIVLNPALSPTAADHAIGIGGPNQWYSIPLNTTGNTFLWYGGTTNVAGLDGTGNLNIAGNLSASNAYAPSGFTVTTSASYPFQLILVPGSPQTQELQFQGPNYAITCNGASGNISVLVGSTIATFSTTGLNVVGSYQVGGTKVVGTQITGYGTPTGGAKIASFPGASATLAQTSGALAQLILDLKTHGLLGA